MSSPGALLLNLGSPSSPDPRDVKRYLDQFLMDERVIDYPYWKRALLVRGIILRVRPRKTAEAYRKIWTETGSPLVLTSLAQCRSVEEKVSIPVSMGMRYGEPSTASAVASLLNRDVDRILIFPLYPQYATSSFETAYQEAIRVIREQAPEVATTLVQPFYRDPDYITALAASVQPYLQNGEFDKLLISFHGIPERHLRKADPSGTHCLSSKQCCAIAHPAHASCYRHQCLTAAQCLLDALDIPRGKTFISFQSRLGRQPWLRPYTDHILERFAEEGIKRLYVLCPAFVSDCLEPLEEIGISGKADFERLSGGKLTLIPCLNEHPRWIQYLADKINHWAITLDQEDGE